MKADITREECEQLKKRFYKYCNSAEQHEFVKLYKIDKAIQETWKDFDKILKNPAELNTMFRVILKAIGASKEEIEIYGKED